MSTTIVNVAIGLTIVLVLALVLFPLRHWLAQNWRQLLSRLPLPMLALAASYGVYRFALLYSPWWVAVVQAAAFETTYTGLAVLDDLDAGQRKRATWISVGAVVVSIIYNTIASMEYRNPGTFVNLAQSYEWAMAFLHAAPLAIVAALVANLLLHGRSAQPPIITPVEVQAPASKQRRKPQAPRHLTPTVRVLRQEPAQLPAAKSVDVLTPIDDRTIEVVRLRDEDGLSFGEIGARLGFSRQAAQQRYKVGKEVQG